MNSSAGGGSDRVVGPGRDEVFRTHIEPEIATALRVARTVTGSRVEAEDLVQETLVRAWRAADRFDGKHPRAWLLTILRRTHLNMIRPTRPDPVGGPADLDGHRPAFGTRDEPGPAERVLEATLDPALEWALAGLDARLRVTVLLVDVDQLSYAEVAAVLDVPLGTVVSRVSRGRAKLRRRVRAQPVGSKEDAR